MSVVDDVPVEPLDVVVVAEVVSVVVVVEEGGEEDDEQKWCSSSFQTLPVVTLHALVDATPFAELSAMSRKILHVLVHWKLASDIGSVC